MTEGRDKDALYGVSQKTIRALEVALELGQADQVQRLLAPLHAADVATVIEYLALPLRQRLVEFLGPHFDPEILTHLDEIVREEVVALVGPHTIAEVIQSLGPDEIIPLVEDLDPHQQKAILSLIPVGERRVIEQALAYPEESAARLMQRDMVCVPSAWTVDQAIRHVAGEPELPEKFYALFVTDADNHPLGMVSLSLLLRYPSETRLVDIMDGDIKPIPAAMDQEDVALLFRKYGLISAPVVDEKGSVLGVITIDNVVDVIEEEAEQDIMLLSRVTESDFYAPLLMTSYFRMRWLILMFLNSLMAVFVISRFQTTIEKMVALAILMPICSAMSGNAGMQVVTVTVRALATRELGGTNMYRAIGKETLVGIINGIVFGIVLGGIAAVWFENPALGIVLAVSLSLTMISAAVGGVIFPLLISHFKMDPAISAGPLLTTTTDVLGFAIFLELARVFLM